MWIYCLETRFSGVLGSVRWMVGIDLEGPFQLQWFSGHADLIQILSRWTFSLFCALYPFQAPFRQCSQPCGPVWGHELDSVILVDSFQLRIFCHSVILWSCTGGHWEACNCPWSLLIGLHGFLYHCNNFCLSFLPFMELPNLPDFPFYLDLFYTQFHLPIMEVYKTLLPWSPLILFYYSTYFS